MRLVKWHFLTLIVVAGALFTFLFTNAVQALQVSKTDTTPGEADGSSFNRTFTFTTADFSAGSTVTDVNVTLDFAKIDNTSGGSCSPLINGTGTEWNDELYFQLTNPAGTRITLIAANTYTGRGYGGRVTVTLDDAATTALGGIPTSGTFLPLQPLSTFNGTAAVGDWVLRVGDNLGGDPLCYFGSTLDLTVAEPPTPTPTNTPTDTPTSTPTPTPTNTPTDTPTSTPTDTPTNTPTSTPTDTPTNTPTSTPTDIPTDTPTSTPTDTPSATPTSTATNTATLIPTSTPTLTPVPTHTAPPPPPTPLCAEHNFDESGVVRSSITDTFGYAINCRILYQNGAPTQWLGGDLYTSGSLGIEGLVDLGIEQAVDIFSPPGLTYFFGGAVFCLRGEGYLVWLAASGIPRQAEIIESYTVPEFDGFTCVTLFEPGTLVLVAENPDR